MDRRTLFFVIAVSWIFVIYMMMSPPKKDQDKKNDKTADAEVEQKDEKGVGADAKGNPKQDSSNENSKPDQPGDADPKDSTQPGKGETKTSDDVKKDPTKDDPSKDEPSEDDEKKNQDDSKQETKPTRRTIEPSFVNLGSLAVDSQYRFLVTFNTKAASIHRLELVQRHRNSELLRYKDLEVRYGYLGHLDLTDDSEGPRIQTVGSHTPADLAGLKVGDVITGLGETDVTNRLEFVTALRNTKPGQEVSITYLRDQQTATASVTLMRQPLEVIRPDQVPEEFAFPFNQIRKKLSYGISLFNPVGSNWEKIGEMDTDAWEPEVSESSIKFYYPYKSEKEIRDSGFDYQVIKTFSLIPNANDEVDDVTAMSYHLNLDIEVKNLSKQGRSFAYRIDGPNGLPTEDWWFAIKIHGDWSAMFSQAGARDVVASTEARSFQFIGGPKIYSNAISQKKQKIIPIIDPGSTNPGSRSLNYLGVDSHYFVSALIPTDGESKTPREAFSAQALPQWIPLKTDEEKTIDPQRKKEAGWYRKIVPVNFKAYFQFENPDSDSAEDRYVVAPNQTVRQSFMIFAGPKEPALLSHYGIGDVVTYGWFGMFSWPLVTLLHFFHAIIGNYGIAIVLLTVLVRLAMMRFSRKMVVNTQMMQVLAPEIKAITERYKDDFQGKSKAQQELFKKYNYNPFSGCLVMLIQLPVFIGLYRGLSVDMALRDEPLIPGVGWCSNLAGPDQLWRWQEDLPQFLSFLTHETGWLGPYFNLLPIISVVLMLIQQKLFTPPPADEQQAFMQKIMTFMMIFIGVIFFKVPAGLCIYFITSTLWAVMEKKLIPPPQLPSHLQRRLDDLKALQAKEKEDGVAAGTYTNATATAGGTSTRKHTERAKKRSQKNRRK